MNPQLQFMQAPHQFTFDAGPPPQQKQKPKKKGNLLTSLIPSGGGIAGAAGGAAIGTAILPGIGTIAGGLIGGALGGGAGKVAENAIEHNKLTNGVAGEAAMNGVLGAGPLRLAKVGVDTARGIKAGTSLADAVVSAGEKGVAMSAAKAAGGKLEKAGQSLIAKEFRLNPTQQANFKKLTGEEAVSVLRRYGVKKPEDLAAKIAPLQSAFDSVVTQIPSASKNEVSVAMKAIYDPLIKSPVITRKQLGQQVKDQADAILKQSGKEISATDLNGLKQAFDDAVKYTQHGTNEFTVNKKSADAIRRLLQGKADQAGLKFEGKTFKDVGLELRKLHNLDDIVGKQSYLGTGSLPLNIPSLIGTTAGGAAGGLPGAALAGVATQAINSPAGRRIAANGVIGAGEKLSAKGAASSPYGIKSVASRVAPVGLADALMGQMGQSDLNSMPANATTNSTTTMPMSANMTPLNQTNDNMSSPDSPFAPQNLENAIQQILSNGGSIDDVSKFVTIAGTIQKARATAAPAAGYSKPTASQYAQGVSGQQSIAQLQQLLQQDPSLINKGTIPGQGMGVLGSLESGALGTSDYKAVTHNILNSVARINTGANMPPSEEAFYRKTYLPQPGDSEQTKQDKISALQSFFNPITHYGGGQDPSGDLVSALMTAQGGY